MPIVRELGGREIHYYGITLAAGQYLHAIIDQQDIDVVLTVLSPDGNQIAEVDRPSGSRGPEGVSVVAQVAGTHCLQVRPLKSAAARGHYQVKVDEIRSSIPDDTKRMLAERAVTEAEEFRARGTAESLQKAIARFAEAITLWRALNEPYEEGVSLYGVALTYRLLGENQTAVSSFIRAIALMRQVGDRYGEATALTGIAWAYLYLGESEIALHNFTLSLTLRRSIGDRFGEGLALYGIGWAHSLMEDNQKALGHFLESLRIRQEIADRGGEALTLAGIGKIYSLLNKKEESLDYLNRALSLLRALGNRYGEADTLSSIGWVLYSLGQTQTALDYFEQALPIRRAVGDRTGEITTLYGLARAERRRGNFLKARSNIETAVDIIESLRSSGTSQQLRVSYLASVQDYYEFWIDLLMRLYELDPSRGYDVAALEASERARARGLLELLTEAHTGIWKKGDPVVFEAERALDQELNPAEDGQRRVLGTTHSGKDASVAARDGATLATRLGQSSPCSAGLTHATPLSLKEIQQQVVDDDTLLLEYSLGKERSFLWVVSPTSIKSLILPKGEDIEAASHHLCDLLTARNRYEKDETSEQRRARVRNADAQYLLAAERLSELLLGPTAAQLGTKRLVIVAQGPLHIVPFAALPAPLLGNTVFRAHGRPRSPDNRLTAYGYRPLIVDHEIVHLPSASTLGLLRRDLAGRKPAPKTVAVLADPVFTKDDGRVSVTPLKAGTPTPIGGDLALQPDDCDPAQGLPRLFASRWEAEQITSLAPAGDTLKALDFAASRSTATSPGLADYRILHFATHALIDNVHPDLSELVLSQIDEYGQPQDGFLRAREIATMNLPAELVVLSACRTGLGKEIKGEGLLGLTRAFMYAGSPRVVVSLWSVRDKATADLMARFYKKMLGPSHQTPAAALRASQVEMLKDKRWRAPYFWAAFCLQGEYR